MMRWLPFALLALAPAWVLGAEPEFQFERTPVAGGAELLTVFSHVPDRAGPVPLVALLRDTLGDNDPTNDRLRYVWTLTAAEPTLLQRAAAAVPFFYWRPNLGRNIGKPPKPVLDLGDPASSVWNSIGQQLMQVAAIDGNGALVRATTRHYRNNLSEQRRVHLVEGLTVLEQLEARPETRHMLSDEEMVEIETRLSLAGKTMGGLVTNAKLPEAYYAERMRESETVGHNWELLRQRAEANGLYFEPLGAKGETTHAMLWIAHRDVMHPSRPFDGAFLNIANPFNDARLSEWREVTLTRYFDRQGRPVDAAAPGAQAEQWLPLALYGLDYPKVPLLLVDFRSTHAPKRREMIARATSDAVVGVVGYSKWGNWPYMAGSWFYDFLRTRRGAATNRQARLRSYSEVRRLVALDRTLPAELREDMQKRLEVLGVNPLEESVDHQMDIAGRQYAALQKYAAKPSGLAKRLERDRESELTAYRHGPAARFGFVMTRVVTFGLYRHHESVSGRALMVALDRARKQQLQIAEQAQRAPAYAAIR